MKAYILLIAAFLLINNSFAAPLVWRINKDHSEILFEVDYLEIATVQGRFEKFKGEVKFDQDLELINKITIVINSKSISTANKMRDNHLRSGPFFNSKQYPLITFKSTEIKPIGPGEFAAIGLLKIKDVQREITFKFKISRPMEDTWGYKNRFVTFNGMLKRHDFGLKWDKTLSQGNFLVGDEIKIRGQFQIQPFNALTPANKHMIPDTKAIRNREFQNRGEEVQESIDVEIEDFTGVELEEEAKTKVAAPVLTKVIKEKEIVMVPEKVKPLWWVAYIASCLLSFAGLSLFTPLGKKLFKSLRVQNESEGVELKRLLNFLAYPMLTIYIVSMLYIGFGRHI